MFPRVRPQYETEIKRRCKNITKGAKILSTYFLWFSCSPLHKTKDKDVLERFTYFTYVETLCISKVVFYQFSDKPEVLFAFDHFGNPVRYPVIDHCSGHFPTPSTCSVSTQTLHIWISFALPYPTRPWLDLIISCIIGSVLKCEGE